MDLPCPVDIDIRLRLQHLCCSGKLLFFYGRVTETLYLADAEKFLVAGKGKGTSCLAGPARSAYAVHIVFRILRQIIIDHDLHIVNVDASCRHIRGDQDIGGSVPETPHGHVSLMLGHIPMESLHLKASLLHHLRKLVHLDLRIAEDKAELRLIIFQQTDACRILVLLLHSVIPLGHQRYGQLLRRYLHQSGILLEFVRNIQNRLGHSSGKQRCLVGIGNLSKNQLHILPESHVQHLVRLVQHHHVHIIKLHSAPAHMVHDPPRRAYDDLGALQAIDLPHDILSAVYRKHLDAMQILCDLADLLRRLHRQLSGRAEHHCLQLL